MTQWRIDGMNEAFASDEKAADWFKRELGKDVTELANAGPTTQPCCAARRGNLLSLCNRSLRQGCPR
jgi:hypothetical protein